MEVHECDKKRGKQAIQHIRIYFNHIGRFENELTQLAEPNKQEIQQMREEIEEARKEKSRAYHHNYSREYQGRNLEKQQEYDRIKVTPGERSNLLTEKKGTLTPLIKPDGVITTQRNGQTIVAELFFNPNGTETFSDKLLKTILADSLCFFASDGQETEKQKFCDNNHTNDTFPIRAIFIVKNAVFPKSRAEENN